MSKLSFGQLNRLMRLWKKLLRVDDWIVGLEITPERHMDGHLGYCTCSIETKTATIQIGDHDLDQEETLVHELLHLHFAPFEEPEGSMKDVAQEQAINCIAYALVALKRKAQSRG